MIRVRGWKYALLLVTLALFSLALGQAKAQTQPAAGKAKVDRLIMGLITPYLDYIRPWINGTADHNIQHDPAFEWLIEVAPDGQYKPWLAESSPRCSLQTRYLCDQPY
jgi:ABC-type transport system substrate-binding protein